MRLISLQLYEIESITKGLKPRMGMGLDCPVPQKSVPGRVSRGTTTSGVSRKLVCKYRDASAFPGKAFRFKKLSKHSIQFYTRTIFHWNGQKIFEEQYYFWPFNERVFDIGIYYSSVWWNISFWGEFLFKIGFLGCSSDSEESLSVVKTELIAFQK